MTRLLLTLLMSVVAASPAIAQTSADPHAGHHAPAGAAKPAGTQEMADAVVRKVDLDAAKVTLRHGEIKSLEMPPMTMVFHVRDKTLLDQLKAGDKVKFKAVSEAGQYVVTDIQRVP